MTRPWQLCNWTDVESHIALLFTSRFISPRLCERLGKKYCSRKNGSGERDTDQVTRVRSLKPSRGNAKHVTVLKESERSELRKVHKACPYSARYKARTHVPSNLLFRYSLVSASLPACCPCFLDCLRAYLTDVSFLHLSYFPSPSPAFRANREDSVWRVEWSTFPISDIRLPVAAFGFALTVNYHPAPPLSPLYRRIPI